MCRRDARKEKRKPTRLGRVTTVAILLLFPFPEALLLTTGTPLEWRWPYVLVYAGWIVFALLVDRISIHGWPVKLRVAASRSIRWPHLGVSYLCLGLSFVLFLLSQAHLVSSPVLTWSVWNVLFIVALTEGAIGASNRLIATTAVPPKPPVGLPPLE